MNSPTHYSLIKNIIILSIIYILTAGSFPSDSPKKTVPQPKVKPETKSVPSKKTEKKNKSETKAKTAAKEDKKSECCPVGRKFQSMVELEEICFHSNSTEFRFRLLMDGAMCSISNSIDLTDNMGNSYRVSHMDGIAECPSMTRNPLNKVFTWTFEKVNNAADTLNLTEDRNAVPFTSGWVWWYWNDIDIRQCKRK